MGYLFSPQSEFEYGLEKFFPQVLRDNTMEFLELIQDLRDAESDQHVQMLKKEFLRRLKEKDGNIGQYINRKALWDEIEQCRPRSTANEEAASAPNWDAAFDDFYGRLAEIEANLRIEKHEFFKRYLACAYAVFSDYFKLTRGEIRHRFFEFTSKKLEREYKDSLDRYMFPARYDITYFSAERIEDRIKDSSYSQRTKENIFDGLQLLNAEFIEFLKVRYESQFENPEPVQEIQRHRDPPLEGLAKFRKRNGKRVI
ncbi:MAG: hypothetical protein HC883_01515 [Bdellovibrionaceae bacterium]|nr:hypothetical protein [Pseudobdellovibrionaceae bacterium]